MAVTLQVSNLAKTYHTPLFSGVNLFGMEGDKIGLIGDNGSGKSTLLKMLAGSENAETGGVLWSKDARIGYLEQEIVADTLEVSGGEKKILKIAELFYGEYNVLLLDEPDNHLDLDHKIWFEQLVKDFGGMVIVISHDRSFLENGVNKIWLVEEKKVVEYPFNYLKFKDIYEGNMESRQHLWEVQEKERKRLADLVVRMRAKAVANDKFSGRLHNAEKRYERWVAEMVEPPPKDKELQVDLETKRQHQKKTAVYIQDLVKNYGNNEVLKELNLHVFCGEKIAVNAPNGSGKSTLLSLVSGRLKQDAGRITVGPGLKIGTYTQDHLETLDEHARVIDELQKNVPKGWYEALAYLRKFLFSNEQAVQEVRFLSGGQKSRLQLAKFFGTNPDILILDEPTNHLDLKTVIALEGFLQGYTGTLILVSHDKELVKAVANINYDLVDGKLVREWKQEENSLQK